MEYLPQRKILVLSGCAALFFIAAIVIFLCGYMRPYERLKLSPVSNMTRAELVYLKKTAQDVKAVLVLAPGYNGDGKVFVCDRFWQDFARKHHLGLVGLSFSSTEADLHFRQGYYYVQNGSGQLLLDGIRRIYGKDLPLLLYGFSGGAHFVARLAEWKPERVIGWCALSAGWWDNPYSLSETPPGIIACGKGDDRKKASLEFFSKGRKLGRRWLWIENNNEGHEMSKKLEAFSRNYFSALLRNARGGWITFQGVPVESPPDDNLESLNWLPDMALLPQWKHLIFCDYDCRCEQDFVTD